MTNAEFLRLLVGDALAERLRQRPNSPPSVLLTGPALLRLSDRLASVLAIARLSGRHRTRSALEPLAKFNEPPSAPIGLSPKAAIDWFRRLLGIADHPFVFDAEMNGRAFNLAVTTDQVVTRKIADVILGRIETGKQSPPARHAIAEILDDAGIVTGDAYPEMVFRTNAMEAMRGGAWEEFRSPDLDAMFPVWQYTGIDDGRERHGPLPKYPDHRRWFNKFFDRNVNFFDVRGREARDVINCRCDFIPVNRDRWRRLQAEGAIVTPWPSGRF